MAHGKKYTDATKRFDREHLHSPSEAVDIDGERLKLKVLVNIFGRETPVELEFAQVAKL